MKEEEGDDNDLADIHQFRVKRTSLSSCPPPFFVDEIFLNFLKKMGKCQEITAVVAAELQNC